MLSYDSFKQIMANDFLSYLPKKYQNGEMKIYMGGANHKTDMFSVVLSHLLISPSMDIHDAYCSYLSIGDVNEALEETAAMLVKAIEQRETEQEEYSFWLSDPVKRNSRIILCVSRNSSTEVMENQPYRKMLDLILSYRFFIGYDEQNRRCKSVIITNEIAEAFGLTEEMLYQISMENMQQLLPVTCKELGDVLNSNLPLSLFYETLDNTTLWVISNEYVTNGASSLFYTTQFAELSRKLDSDLFIMPLSTNHLIVIKYQDDKAIKYHRMLLDMNVLDTPQDLVLGEHIYQYHKDTQEIDIAA